MADPTPPSEVPSSSVEEVISKVPAEDKDKITMEVIKKNSEAMITIDELKKSLEVANKKVADMESKVEEAKTKETAAMNDVINKNAQDLGWPKEQVDAWLERVKKHVPDLDKVNDLVITTCANNRTSFSAMEKKEEEIQEAKRGLKRSTPDEPPIHPESMKLIRSYLPDGF